MEIKLEGSFRVQQAAEVIKQGGLVAFPTETVYGLGANAFNAKAVARIFEVKARPFFDPLIIHIASINDLYLLAKEVTQTALLLAEKFWPGPLTMVLPKREEVPNLVTAGLQTVGVRMPNHHVALDLIKQAGSPIAAPSANRFGCLSPTNAWHVKKQLSTVDYILDEGSSAVGIESTIIFLKDNTITMLRHGAITCNDILKVVPNIRIFEKDNASNTVISSGMLKSHYSPNKPLFILGEFLPANFKKEEAALLSFSGKDIQGYKLVEFLTENQDLKKYAANLFSILHKLEESSAIKFIVVEPVPEEGLGIAIMDRLKKAAYRYSNIK